MTTVIHDQTRLEMWACSSLAERLEQLECERERLLIVSGTYLAHHPELAQRVRDAHSYISTAEGVIRSTLRALRTEK